VDEQMDEKLNINYSLLVVTIDVYKTAIYKLFDCLVAYPVFAACPQSCLG
jgi:hypothetical protein